MEQHYSYRVYSDTETARRFDQDRFGGPIGELVKRSQERIVFQGLPEVRGWRVIDVGAGTGRFTLPFLELGASVTACDASPQMLSVMKEKTQNPGLQIVVADAHHLRFPNQSFDCAISFRMLLHVLDWKQALSELCRVSRDWLVFDIPPRHGFLILAPLWHTIRQLFSDNIQAYRIFSIGKVQNELVKNGFEIVASDPGYFLPLVIHRMVRQPSFTRASERFFHAIGITRLAGSPFTIFARRKK